MDRIVNEGIAYNRFHTRAMCSPNQASLLTGRNHHRVGAGQIAGLDNDWDGYSGHIPRRSALMADVLKDYGYATGDWGKWNDTPAVETTPAGPFQNWPRGLGFVVPRPGRAAEGDHEGEGTVPLSVPLLFTVPSDRQFHSTIPKGRRSSSTVQLSAFM
jgi:arylsulfatase A-like enzyme